MAMGHTENEQQDSDDSEDLWDDVSELESGSGARAHLI